MKEKYRKDYNGSIEYTNRYFKEVNCFLGSISKDNINILKDNGFVSWDVKELYVYTIDLLTNKHNIDFVNITSIPEEYAYMDMFWDNWKGTRREFRKGMAEYLERNMGINRDMSIEEMSLLLSKKDWDNSDKYFNINSVLGNKDQYASNIPHLQIHTKDALKYEKVTKIVLNS